MYIRAANTNMANKEGEKEKEWSEKTYQVIASREIKKWYLLTVSN